MIVPVNNLVPSYIMLALFVYLSIYFLVFSFLPLSHSLLIQRSYSMKIEEIAMLN